MSSLRRSSDQRPDLAVNAPISPPVTAVTVSDQHLPIEGMHCASCVGRVERDLIAAVVLSLPVVVLEMGGHLIPEPVSR